MQILLWCWCGVHGAAKVPCVSGPLSLCSCLYMFSFQIKLKKKENITVVLVI